MIATKPGVRWVYAPALFRMLEALRHVGAALQMTLTVTSAADGVHSGPTDPHYTGNAIDVRTHDLADAQKQTVLAGLQAELGPQFVACLEAPHTANEHIHCQRARGTTYTMEDYLNA